MGMSTKQVLVLFTAFILVAGGIAVYGINQMSTTEPGPREEGGAIEGDCNSAPSIDNTVMNALQSGTQITPGSTHYRINGLYQGTSVSTFAYGDSVEMLVNKSGYLNMISDKLTLKCGTNRNNEEMFEQADPSVEIKEDNTVLTDDTTGGASNGSAIAAGGSETFEVCLTGNDKKSTGDFAYIVEVGEDNNVSSVTLSDSTPTDEPDFYSETRSDPKIAAFKVSSLDEATERCHTLTIQAKSGKTIAGAVYTTGYVGEAIVDDETGDFIEWAIEDSDGEDKSESNFDYDVYLE